MQLIIDILNSYLPHPVQLNIARLFVWLGATLGFRFLWKNHRNQSWAAATYLPLVYFGLIVVFALLYVDYPAYYDHVEPVLVDTARALNNNQELYQQNPYIVPYLVSFYGPMPAYIQALAQQFGLPVISASKLPGVLAFSIFVFLAFRQIKTPWGRGCLLFLAPFHIILFWPRAEPFILLLVAITLALATAFQDKKYIPIALGILGGLASGFKIHGITYIFIAFLAANLGRSISLSSFIMFGLAAGTSFLALFLHPSASFITWLKYLSMMAKPLGFSTTIALKPVIFMAFLWSAVFFCCRETKLTPLMKIQLGVILVLEIFLTKMSSNHGAWEYHLAPLVPVHAWLISTFGPASRRESADPPKGSLIVFALYILMIAVSAPVYHSFIRYAQRAWDMDERINREAERFGQKYPGLVMGFAEGNTYPLYYRRVLLPARQINFSALMDLQLIGITDTSFHAKLKDCAIAHILLPKQGKPFAMFNWYGIGPLLSDDTRRAFKEEYAPVEEGTFYSVYACRPKTGSYLKARP